MRGCRAGNLSGQHLGRRRVPPARQRFAVRRFPGGDGGPGSGFGGRDGSMGAGQGGPVSRVQVSGDAEGHDVSCGRSENVRGRWDAIQGVLQGMMWNKVADVWICLRNSLWLKNHSVSLKRCPRSRQISRVESW